MDTITATGSQIPDDLADPKLPHLKAMLVRLGATVPRVTAMAQSALNFMSLGAWLTRHGFTPDAQVRDRRELFRYVAALVTEPALYLEFGVYRGASVDAWRRLLPHPANHFIGFDSFQGMPEDFDERTGMLRGELDQGGHTPPIDDDRVEWVVGWFEDTLPGWSPPPHERLVIHIDCDLYSATILALRAMDPHIKPGTIILFDDMGQPHHEPRAFSEYMRESGKRFRLIACDREDHYAFECA